MPSFHPYVKLYLALSFTPVFGSILLIPVFGSVPLSPALFFVSPLTVTFLPAASLLSVIYVI